MNTSNEYEQQSNDFLTKTGATIEIKFSHNGKHFDTDKENRDIYDVTIKRGSRSFSLKFGQSLNDSGFYYTKGKQKIDIDRKYLDTKNLASILKKTDWDFLNNGKSDTIHKPVAPTNYSILACLTKYDPDTFENFCSEFGYDTDSRNAEKTYKAIKEEYLNICSLFTDSEIELLFEIS